MIDEEKEIVGAQFNVFEVEQALKTDPQFFINFFLSDELTLPIPKFHIQVFFVMINLSIKLFACAIPRDHAKTTLAKLAVIWYFLFSDFRFIIYVSNTSSVAAAACFDIVTFMESENFVKVFGPIEWITKQDNKGNYMFKLRGKLCILKSLGAQQQVRGLNVDNQRPQLAVVDDLESAEEIETPVQYEKLKKWWYGTFRKALDKRGHKIIQLGNIVAGKCLIDENCKSAFWHSMRFGCILSDGTPLWKEAWSIEALKQDYKEYCEAGQAHIWFAEMMNMPMAEGAGLISQKDIFFAPTVPYGQIEYGFITIDPAISEEKWAHKAAITVSGWVDNHWQLVDYRTGFGIDPVTMFQLVVELAIKWNINVIGIENVAFQASLKYVFTYLAQANQLETLVFVPLYAVQRKTQRLSGWAAMIKNKQYALTEGDFEVTTQLLNYDPKRKNNDADLIDAAAYSIQMIDVYLGEVLDRLSLTHNTGRVIGSYEVELEVENA